MGEMLYILLCAEDNLKTMRDCVTRAERCLARLTALRVAIKEPHNAEVSESGGS